MEERAAFGLASDVETVSSLIGSSEDVGTKAWGLPMTAEEESRVDLRGRMDYFLRLEDSVWVYVRGLPSFGGVYIDQTSGGNAVVLLTAPDPLTEQRIQQLAPVDKVRHVEIRYVTHRYEELVAAADSAGTLVSTLAGGVSVYAVAVDEIQNAVRVEVDPKDLDVSRTAVNRASALLGVPIYVVQGEPTVEQQCTSRTNCAWPLKAGILIRRGAPTGPICTMAFHIRVGTDEQFVTAGHCDTSGTSSWYHAGYGWIGTRTATQFYQWGRDAMRVQMPDSQASDDIYGDSPNIVGAGNPVTGMAICASFGYSNVIDCGTVSNAWIHWVGSCGCDVYGADAAYIFGQLGDSGSPLYVIGGGSSEPATAYGVWNTSAGGFARMGDILAAWSGTTIVT
jgi:hypothetical protein